VFSLNCHISYCTPNSIDLFSLPTNVSCCVFKSYGNYIPMLLKNDNVSRKYLSVYNVQLRDRTHRTRKKHGTKILEYVKNHVRGVRV